MILLNLKSLLIVKFRSVDLEIKGIKDKFLAVGKISDDEESEVNEEFLDMQQLFGGSEYYEPNSSSRGDSDEVITSPKNCSR